VIRKGIQLLLTLARASPKLYTTVQRRKSTDSSMHFHARTSLIRKAGATQKQITYLESQ